MKTLVKKTMGILMATLVAFGVMAGTTQAFAAEGHVEHKVVSNLKVDKGLFGIKTGISGDIQLKNTINAAPLEKVKDSENLYKGSVSGSVEAGDLFAGAYELYKNEFKGKADVPGHAWENIVMFGEGGEFPTAQYAVKFPSNFKIDEKAITATENSSAISAITAKYVEKDNSVVITIQLGNWNDYKEFFTLVEGELKEAGHQINVNIPYTVDTTGITSNELGKIEGSGNCYLYKTSGFGKGRIVNITTDNLVLNVTK